MTVDNNASRKRTTGYNSRLPQWGLTWLNQVQCFYQHLCLVDSEVLRIPPLRQAAKRWQQAINETTMKEFISILLLSFLLFSCGNHEEKIEIYLLKNRIRTTEGIPVLEYVKLKNIKYDDNLENMKDCNFDSVSRKLIYGGKFNVEKESLETEPLIADEDILKLNLKKSELILSEIGKKKIAELKPNMKYGVQFAICVNRKPILTGYFRSIYSSYIYNWNYINYDHYNKEKRIDKDTNFVIRQNQGYENWMPIFTELEKYPELIKAFNETNRLEN